MTPRTLQCEVFWALLSSSKHSGVPEDSKSPTLEVLGFTPTLGQSGVATDFAMDFACLDIFSHKERNDLEMKDNTMVTFLKCIACKAPWPGRKVVISQGE
jgi:hypothetical protein